MREQITNQIRVKNHQRAKELALQIAKNIKKQKELENAKMKNTKLPGQAYGEVKEIIDRIDARERLIKERKYNINF